ncbi:ubinuclein-1 [Takifugu rubripes]|uniref:ubinuclein-1 n=1 Tax=Takifugu rubripes TaxID=31033 RepID=UPI0011455A71|nr:ubinuclein-1-like [Takifugu rubripes]XP_011611154.2 ubinuclein-1-like [Takifugu rubripes]XP_029707151.1 ubinuclein-1-like [Takifugu rubripes]XP_029707152.1 ubinuclein-1-like [Takifugu rubripes]
MAKPRRVQLTALPRPFPSSSFTSDVRLVETRPDRPADTHTVRLFLNLFEPDEQSFPEFNYTQLIDRTCNGTEDKVPLSRLEEEEREQDETAALVKKLEEKYGSKTQKIDRIQDLIDIGYGYDEDDSFIDNSEAYDEFVPACLTTTFGGFYVNSGTLHFRLTSDLEDTSHPEMSKGVKKRKRNPGGEKLKKVRKEDGGMKTNEDPQTGLSGADGERKKNVSTPSVPSMLKTFPKEAGMLEIPLCPMDAPESGVSGLTDPLLSLIGSTNDHALIQAASAVDFDIDLDSLLEASEGMAVTQPAADLQLLLPNKDDVTQAPPPDAHLQLKPPVDQTNVTFPNQYVCLPDGVPPGLAAAIEKLAVAAKTSEGESKLKFFTPEINSILLDIELQCREHGGQLRSKVYTHLSSFLPCSRDTVLKRVKKLLLAHRDSDPEIHLAGCRVLTLTSDSLTSDKKEPHDRGDPLNKLKEAISTAMLDQITHFYEIRKAYDQPKAPEEETDAQQKLNLAVEDNVEDRGWKRGSPKKMFKWTEEIRECLSQVLKAKLEKNKEKGSQELEEVLKTLLDKEVKPLWPRGWMQSRVLMRESRKLLGLLPSLLVKKARAEKKQVVSSGPGDPLVDSGVAQCSPPMRGASKKPEYRPRGTEGAPAGSSTSVESAGCPLVTSAPGPSPLNLLADQVPEQPLLVPQELLAAAIAKYNHSVRSWSFALDTKSPPLPPPPPQSSPVEFPVRGVYHLLPLGDFSGYMDAGQPTDGADAAIQ